jgi:hypothetical protein
MQHGRVHGTAVIGIFASLVVVALPARGGGGGGTLGAALEIQLASDTEVPPDHVVEFGVRATGPRADAVTLALLNPPPGCVFTPLDRGALGGAASGGRVVTARGWVRWLVPNHCSGRRRLTFRAIDATTPSLTVSASVDVRVAADDSTVNVPVLVGDVTGDGVLDAVVGATYADVSPVVDSGAIYVWHGKTAPSGPPDATLARSSATPSDLLGLDGSQGIQLADVTGDGVLDVVAAAAYADVGGVVDAGLILVWKGGPTLAGAPPPFATLADPAAVKNDRLGSAGFQLADVTGDHVVDVVVGTVYADVGSVVDAGALCVWRGGLALTGAPAPLAKLTVPGAAAQDQFGRAQLADVTGDGVLDVIAATPLADAGGVVDAGALSVWAGGAALRGSPAPLATLAAMVPASGDRLGSTVNLGDVNGDGVLDLVVGAPTADLAGVVDCGVVLVWSGGTALTGARPRSRRSPSPALSRPTSSASSAASPSPYPSATRCRSSTCRATGCSTSSPPRAQPTSAASSTSARSTHGEAAPASSGRPRHSRRSACRARSHPTRSGTSTGKACNSPT